jgi:hypothetical protein
MRRLFFFSFGYYCYRACSTHVVEIPRMHSHIILHTSNKINNHTFLFAAVLKKRDVSFWIIQIVPGLNDSEKPGVWSMIVKYV